MDMLSAAPSLALRRAYRKAGVQTWMLIRELYLAGVSAAELAVRFDVSVHTVRKRATREGWSRKAQAEAVADLRTPRDADWRSPPALPSREPAPEAAPPEPPPEADPGYAAERLWRRAAGAALAGRLSEALTMAKLAETLGREAPAPGWDAPGDGFGRIPPPEPPHEPMDPAEIERKHAFLEEKIMDYHRSRGAGSDGA